MEYTLGRGKVFFAKGDPDTQALGAYYYLGNTPAFNVTSNDDTLDHYSSDSGLKVLDMSITLQHNLSVNFETDHISPENLARWYKGDITSVAQAATTVVGGAFTDDILAIEAGGTYQLGVDPVTRPQGKGNLALVGVFVGTSTIAASAGDYTFDGAHGMIALSPNPTDIVAGSDIHVKYNTQVKDFLTIIDRGKDLFGALKYIADNPKGTNKDQFYPWVKISSNGDYELKGDELQKLSFTASVLKKNTVTDYAYLRSPKGVGY